MARQRIVVLASASAVFALCSLASMSAAVEVVDEHALQLDAMEQSIAVIPDYDLEEVTAAMVAPDRLPESPGGVYAIGGGSSNTKTEPHRDVVPPGGAVGLASFGIRGPTSA